MVNIKPYCSGNKIKRMAKPITGKLLSKKATQIEEAAINFSIVKDLYKTQATVALDSTVATDKKTKSENHFSKVVLQASAMECSNYSTRCKVGNRASQSFPKPDAQRFEVKILFRKSIQPRKVRNPDFVF